MDYPANRSNPTHSVARRLPALLLSVAWLLLPDHPVHRRHINFLGIPRGADLIRMVSPAHIGNERGTS